MSQWFRHYILDQDLFQAVHQLQKEGWSASESGETLKKQSAKMTLMYRASAGPQMCPAMYRKQATPEDLAPSEMETSKLKLQYANMHRGQETRLTSSSGCLTSIGVTRRRLHSTSADIETFHRQNAGQIQNHMIQMKLAL